MAFLFCLPMTNLTKDGFRLTPKAYSLKKPKMKRYPDTEGNCNQTQPFKMIFTFASFKAAHKESWSNQRSIRLFEGHKYGQAHSSSQNGKKKMCMYM